MKKNHIVIIFLGIIGISLFFIKFSGQNAPKKVMKATVQDKILEEISRVWRLGPKVVNKKEKEACTEKNVPEIFYECNPDFIQCVYEHRLDKKVNFSKGNLKYKIYSKQSQSSGNWPDYSLWGEIRSEDSSQEFLLTDECRSLYLPQRVYHYDPSNQKKWTWDNFDRHLFVDKYVVTNRDIMEWVNQEQVENINYDKTNLHLPAEYLKRDQMESFCRYRGKRLLTAKVHDAIATLPFDREVTQKPQEFNSLVPWSRKETSIFKAWEKIPKEQQCSKAVSSECKLEEKELSHFKNPSWSGHFMVFGGYLEYVENNIHPRRNLKASSMFFNRNSFWFKIGERAYWNGDGFGFRNFNWRGEDPDKEFNTLGVTFRCMKEQYTYEPF